MGAYNALNLGILLRDYEESAVLQKMREFDCPVNAEINTFFHEKTNSAKIRISQKTPSFLAMR